MRLHQFVLINLLPIALAQSACARAVKSGSQRPIHISVTARVADVKDTIPLFGVVAEFNSIRGHRFARSDSTGQLNLQVVLHDGVLKAQFSNGFYMPVSLERRINSDGAINLGLVLLSRGPPPIEYVVVPWCEAVARRPKSLPDGTWIQRDLNKKHGGKVIVCDGYLREPRVLQTRASPLPHTR